MAGAKPGVHVVLLKPIAVPETLIKGNKFIKWDESSQTGTPVTLKVDPKGYILYWKDQNKDMDFLDISLIRDTRTGKYAKVPKEGKLRDNCMIGQIDTPLEEKTVTICYGKDMTNIEFVNFVCGSREVAREWTDELLSYATNLLALNGSVLSYLEKAHTKLTHVLDVNGRIPVRNIIKMVASHRDDKRRVEKALESVGFMAGKNETIDPGKFTFEDFFNFYRHLVGRTEVDKVFDEVGAKKKPYLTVEQFVQFLNKEQRDPRLNEILYPYYTIKQAQEFINLYETKNGMAAKGHLSQEGFLKYLMSEENNIVPPELLDLSHDMGQSLSHYFINSSHNTYLTGCHQLTGRSSVEMYRQVLLSGCRCIELDCWDGRNADEEPVITHGYTMCTEISFKEVIEAIAESAFKTSEYPVILSFENHCSHKQQAKMAAHCRNIFGEMLLTECMDGFPLEVDIPLPSPHLLKRKIIVKNKKKHFHKEKVKVQKTSSSIKLKVDGISLNGETKGGGTGDEGGGTLGNNEPLSTVKECENEESGHQTVTSPSQSAPPAMTSPDRKPRESISEDALSDGAPNDLDEHGSDSESSESEDDDAEVANFKKEKGTAGKEAEAALEMSALVNYVQPVHFHSFESSEKKRKSFEISSFVESQATSLLKEYPVEFVNYNKRQLSRIYPRGTRVDSGNFLPQIFWNAGCQLVALNFQTLDTAMQLNLGIFEYNNQSGYILKPDFMRRTDRRFDPFAESIVDGIVAGMLSIRFLTDKKVGTYVEVDMYGLPTDTVRKKHRTKIVPANGINPVYDEEPFQFKKVVLPNLAVIRIAVFDENNKMLGHRVLPVEGLRPGYRHIAMRNECNLPLLLPTVFVHISVKDYVPDEMSEFIIALSNPIAYLSEMEKHSQQLAVLEDPDDPEIPLTSETSPPITNGSPVRRESSNIPTDSVTNGGIRPTKPKEGIITKPSITSNSSAGSVPPHPPLKSITSEAVSSQLNEPEILQPTPLKELKEQKPYFKVLAKREKELETLSKKHEKARENMKEIHEMQEERLMIQQVKAKTTMEKLHAKILKKALKNGNIEQVEQANQHDHQALLRDHEEKHKELRCSQAETFLAMCKDHFQAELEVLLRHHEPIYDTLKLVMDCNHRDHRKRLKVRITHFSADYINSLKIIQIKLSFHEKFRRFNWLSIEILRL
ncbi:hypothetical protein FSP39_008286 [Pinctada imbricata]|uniref:1-phosphatidylinositol 4,5-bisphosphate phosphodiesterase n=1 Tax=Pinctada imbricata TaxID=66713 RepID=A0AA88XVX6_PINIB|nr:hypothetical protein FSP39_008286 [Pinctada imbricata]